MDFLLHLIWWRLRNRRKFIILLFRIEKSLRGRTIYLLLNLRMILVVNTWFVSMRLCVKLLATIIRTSLLKRFLVLFYRRVLWRVNLFTWNVKLCVIRAFMSATQWLMRLCNFICIALWSFRSFFITLICCCIGFLRRNIIFTCK